VIDTSAAVLAFCAHRLPVALCLQSSPTDAPFHTRRLLHGALAAVEVHRHAELHDGVRPQVLRQLRKRCAPAIAIRGGSEAGSWLDTPAWAPATRALTSADGCADRA
jgi:hypothetical protein